MKTESFTHWTLKRVHSLQAGAPTMQLVRCGCRVWLVTCTPYRRSIGPVVRLIEDGQHLSLGVYRRGHLPYGPLGTAPRKRRGTVATTGRRRREQAGGESGRRFKEGKD